MVFAFLPTAVLYLCSCAGFLLTFAMIFLAPQSLTLLCSILFLCSAAGIMISYIISDKLDHISQKGFFSDFSKSFNSAVKSSRRCFGSYRTAALLDTAYYCCAYERLDEARDLLQKTKRRIEKSGNSPYRAAHLFLVLEYRKKSHDMKNIGTLISQTADCISSVRYVTRNGRTNAEQALLYSAAELELYSKTADELRNSRRDIAERMYRLSAERIKSEDNANSYKRLCFIYDHAISCLLTGRNLEAESCFKALSLAHSDFPLCHRVQRYLLSRDISVLMETTP